MRSLRVLKQDAWYELRTGINNREPLFRRYTALAIFARVFRETGRRFAFSIRAGVDPSFASSRARSGFVRLNCFSRMPEYFRIEFLPLSQIILFAHH
jgi:hypothetical protein